MDKESAEVARLRRELDAAVSRINSLQQSIKVAIHGKAKDFTEISYANGPPDGCRTVTTGSEAPIIPESLNLHANKNTKFVFIPASELHATSNEDLTGGLTSPIQIEDEDDPGASPPPAKRPSKSSTPAATIKPKKTPGAKSQLAERPIQQGNVKGSASETQPENPITPYSGPGAGVCHTRAFKPTEELAAMLASAKKTGANIPLPPQPPILSAAIKGAPMHDDNVAALLKFWPHDDSVAALAQTMSDDGIEDLQAAHQLLVQQRSRRIAQAVREKGQEVEQEPLEPDETIRADGELAAILAGNPSAINVVLHLVDAHQRIRNGHSTELGRTAANLIAHRQVQNFAGLKQISKENLQKIAQSVIYDCRECENLRVKAKAAQDEAERTKKEEEARKAKERTSKAAEEERKRRAAAEKKEREDREAERSRQAATPPLDDLDNYQQDSHSDPFDVRDAKWAKRRKVELCWNCGKGDLGGDRTDLFICEVCDKCFHKPCTTWSKVIRSSAAPSSSDYEFACRNCCRNLPVRWRLYTEGDDPAPTRNRTDWGDGLVSTPPAQIPRRPGAGAGAVSAAPPPTDPRHNTLDLTQLSHAPPSGLNSTLFSAGNVIKVDRYFEWKPTPSDWDLRKTHPECGLSEPAYKNWKSTNISRRDASGTPPTLGPLTNAISLDMYVSVGSALLNFDYFKEGRTDLEINEWVKKDPSFKWVKQVSDQDLLKYLDKHFSILDHEPFLALKFPGPDQGYSTTTEDGDTNYFATSFGNFADKWLRSLKDLRQGGWDDTHRDLKQAFVNALEAQPTLFREANTYKTESHDLLISHMRAWCILRENQVNKNAQTRAQTAAVRSGERSPGPKSPGNIDKYEKQIKVLRTEVANLKQNQNTDRPITARIPASVDSKTQWYCHGCGKTYSRDGRPIPCEKQCVYFEHAEHNQDYRKGKAWPIDKTPLTWGTIESYLSKYKKEMPATGKRFIELRAKYAARKRERPADKDAA